MLLKEFMFLISVFVLSAVSPFFLTDTLASMRSEPSSMLQSDASRYSKIAFTAMGYARTIVVNTGEVREVFQHPRIVFDVDSIDGKRLLLIADIGDNSSPFDDRLIKLGDLKVPRGVGIEIRLTVELAELLDIGLNG